MLDLQTLNFSSVFASFISSIFFILVWFVNRNITGINLWLSAMLVQPIGWLLLAFRSYLPDWLSIFVANALLILSMLLILLGWRAFLHLKPLQTKIIAPLILLFCASLLYFIYVSPNVTMRIVIIHGSCAILTITCIYNLLSIPRKKRTIGGTIFSSICTLILILNLLRIVTSISFFQVDLFWSFSLNNIMFAFLVSYGLTLSIFLLCNERKITEIRVLERKAKMDAQVKQNNLTTLSHELRTPLNAIIGKAQLMRPLLNSKQLQQDCDIIIGSGQALAQLTKETLDLTLLAQNRSSVKIATELKPYLNNIIQLLMPLAQEKHLKLTLNVAPRHTFLLDQNKIRQILINLLGNAIKFTQRGSINLTVNVQMKTTNTAILNFAVTDTGIGISLDEQGYLMQPAYQNMRKNTSDDKYQEGYGLGLSLCEKLLQDMDAQLSFSSIEGKGSKFYFSITTKTAQIKTQVNPIATYQGLNVLLVEDIQLNQDIAKAMLEQDNHKVTIASTGSEAILCANSQLYDIIFLDMQLPDIHGLDVLERIRMEGNLNINTPIIALTATITDHDIKLYHEANITELIEKPILLASLRESISRSRVDYLSKQATITRQRVMGKIAPPIFDVTLLAFLLENLSTEKFSQALLDAPQNIFRYLENSQQSQDYQSQIKWLHKLAGYSAQLGLVRLSKKTIDLEMLAEQQKQSVHIDLDELVKQSTDAIIAYNKNRDL
jgi:signal transduction histidine kinase/AmiR/NasT family two-component response regulator